MSSEQNDNSTSFSPSEPKLCVNGCGFFGTPSNMNLCSKCYRDIRATEEQAASAIAAVEKSLYPNKPQIQPQQSREVAPGVESGSSSSTSVGDSSAASSDPPKPTGTTRCLSCNKKVGVTGLSASVGALSMEFTGIQRVTTANSISKERREKPLLRQILW